jgi:hypothetical protein
VTTRRRGIKRYQSKGRWYTYHGPTTKRILAEPDTAEFQAEIAAAEALVKPSESKRRPLAIFNYLRSDEFKRLPPHARSQIRAALKLVSRTSDESRYVAEPTCSPPKLPGCP